MNSCQLNLPFTIYSEIKHEVYVKPAPYIDKLFVK